MARIQAESESESESESTNPLSRRQLSVQFGAQQAQTIVGKVIQKSCDYHRLGKCNEKPKRRNKQPSGQKPRFHVAKSYKFISDFLPQLDVASFHFAS